MNTFHRVLDTVFALLLVNALLVFGNIWPTPWPQFKLAASAELALLMLAGAIWRWRGGTLGGWRISAVAGLLLVLVVGRYLDVTAPALYGRPVNLYWDLPHVINVTGMMARAAPPWASLLAVVVTCALLLGLFLLLRAAVGAVNRGLDLGPVRIGMVAVGAVILIAGLSQLRAPTGQHEGRIARPVTATWVSQVLLLQHALSASVQDELPPSPPLQSSLRALDGRDMMVVFLESYGSATDDRPELQPDIDNARSQLAAAARSVGLDVVSAAVTSPTFGGNSWLAHLSFLTGIEVRDPERYTLLMTQQRRSLGHPFAEAGYRRVGVMPGLKRDWPEGAFYGYDTVLDDRSLDYRGPRFGWWRIPDQYTLARLAASELEPAGRAPVYAVFANINTHLPFTPIPPLQADWSRMLTSAPYDDAPLANALAREPRWTDMTQDYADALRYSFATLAGFVRLRGRQAPVIIMLGDHQPPANIAGPGARWDVPVHVLAPPGPILQRLQDAGFTPGMTPPRAPLAPMHELAGKLLAAFD